MSGAEVDHTTDPSSKGSPSASTPTAVTVGVSPTSMSDDCSVTVRAANPGALVASLHEIDEIDARRSNASARCVANEKGADRMRRA